jgi:hypothetical protein
MPLADTFCTKESRNEDAGVVMGRIRTSLRQVWRGSTRLSSKLRFSATHGVSGVHGADLVALCLRNAVKT